MKRQAYYPSRIADQIVWLENFRNKLPMHATALGLTTERSEAAVSDARWVIYVLGSWLPAVRAWQKSCTEAANAAQYLSGEATLALPVFTPPTLPPGVTPRASGAVYRIFDLTQELKELNGYTAAIGTDLGALGPEKTPPDFATLQPTISAAVSGSKVEITWDYSGFAEFLNQLEIHVDRGTGWQILTFDSTPGSTDTTPHPHTLTRWKYRAIYRAEDQQIGLWSAETSVVVG